METRAVFQLHRGGMVVRAPTAEVARLRERFAQQHCIQLPGLIDARAAQTLLDTIDRSEFFERVHEGGGKIPPVDLCLKNDKLCAELSFLLNDRSVLDLVEQLTGCRVASFRGVVYRIGRERGYDVWHDDVLQHRKIALSINLTRGLFSGGVLQLREKASQRILHEYANTGLGDAVLFRIAPEFEHKVSEILGDVPRTAFAGWFMSEPDFLTSLKRAGGRAEASS